MHLIMVLVKSAIFLIALLQSIQLVFEIVKVCVRVSKEISASYVWCIGISWTIFYILSVV